MTREMASGDEPLWRVLPDDREWRHDLRTLGDRLLDHLAVGAGTAEGRWELPRAPYAAAADACACLNAAVPASAGTGLYTLRGPDGTPQQAVHVVEVSSAELDALWEVFVALLRTLEDEPGTEELRDLVQQVGARWSDVSRSPEELIAQLQRVVTVLELDIPAVQTLARAITSGPRGQPLDEVAQSAYAAVTTSWAAVLAG
ncbi:hypothetical protein [Streptomyces sp. MnatMP-M17]|uniref:hypothetical protein n=2 Tax=unclassified Streptomyces TaxID=2593676 RepID=UPI00159EF534|nr:hypothetical protein [Streptomyces sp. MnatMP-M17]